MKYFIWIDGDLEVKYRYSCKAGLEYLEEGLRWLESSYVSLTDLRSEAKKYGVELREVEK